MSDKTQEQGTEQKVSAFNARLSAQKIESVKAVKVKHDERELKQRSYRATDKEYKDINDWADALTEVSGWKGRGITPVHIVRGLIGMKDKISDKQLLAAIKDNL